ncbi:MAG: T9SS type A sorting domain-containing protein, partial [Bacteroidota bacterium]
VNNLATISGTFALDNPNLASFTGVSEGAILPQFNPDNNSFSFVANGSDGMPLGDNITTLFFIHLDLGNGVGTTDIELADTPISLEVSAVQNGVPILLAPNYLPGFVEISANLLGNISSLAYTTDGDEVEDAVYQLSEPDGTYVIDLPRDADGIPSTLAGLSLGRMYYVEPVRDGDPRNGLSSFEIFLGQRWLLGYDVPQITDPLQIVAADMNCSQSFTNLDLMLMQRLLLNELDEVPGCNAWTFVPESHEFAADWNRNNIFPAPRRAEVVLESDTMVMFTGLKTGDLLFDADPGRSTATLSLTVAVPEGIRTGEVRELTVRLPEERSLVSFQGVLRVAPGLELLSVTTADLPTLATGESHLSRGKIALSWFSETGQSRALPAGAGIVSLTVRATTNLSAAANLLAFADRDARVANVAYDGDLRRLTPRVETTLSTTPTFRLLPATPNPADEFADVRFELPAAASVELTVFDGLGRLVITRRQELAAGPSRFRLDLRSLAAGVYTYRVRAGEDAGTGRIIRE